MRRAPHHLTVLLALLSCTVALGGGPLPDNFTLGKYVPENVWMYMNWVSNPEAKFLDDEWGRVIEALKESGIDRDLMSLIVSTMDEADREKTEGTINKLLDLVKQIDWNAMMAKEVVYAMRVAEIPLPYDYIILCQGTPGSGEKNMAALVSLAKEICSWSDDISFGEVQVPGVEVWSVTPKDEDLRAMLALYLLRKGDMVGLVIGQKGFKEVADLIKGEAGGQPVASSKRFAEAMSHVKPPEDGFIYFDAKRLLADLSTMTIKAFEAEKKKSKEGEVDQEAEIAGKLINEMLRTLDVVDYSITSIETVGRTQLSHDVTLVQEGQVDGPIMRLVLKQKPFEKFDQFIPATATGFSATGLIDLGGLYDLILEFIEKHVPDGKKGIESYNAMLASTGFDPKRDLFSWWSGEMISITIPPEVVTPMSSADSVLMIRVSDSKLATEKIGAGLDWITEFAQANGQPLMVSPAEVGAEGFREITHPMMAMFLRPVIGVHEDWLIIGSSGSAISQCLAVAAGEAPSIVTNERFVKEGLRATGAVHSISFTDLSNLGQELGGAVGIIGMVGGMVTANIPDEEGKAIVQKVLTMLMKLAPVLQKIDFYSSQASVTTIDGRRIQTESIITYKPARSEREEKTTKKSRTKAVAPD